MAPTNSVNQSSCCCQNLKHVFFPGRFLLSSSSLFFESISVLSSDCGLPFSFSKLVMQGLQLTAAAFSFSFWSARPLVPDPRSRGITSGAAVCITRIFQEHHRSSAKCLGSCCALRGAAIFPVTFRSATPSGAGACSSVRLPKSCVWMHVKHKKQT